MKASEIERPATGNAMSWRGSSADPQSGKVRNPVDEQGPGDENGDESERSSFPPNDQSEDLRLVLNTVAMRNTAY